MSLILGIDLETTGLDFQKDRIVELGAALWDTDLGMPVKMLSALILEETFAPISEEAFEAHGISHAVQSNYGEHCKDVFPCLEELSSRCDYLLGHNFRDFDNKMLESAFNRADMNWNVEKKPIIDTMTDLPFPRKIKVRSLEGLGAAHGFLNPFPHRALTDVLSAFTLFSKYPLQEVLALANSPVLDLMANVPFERKDEAKAQGFKWDALKRIWRKRIKECLLSSACAGVSFEILVIVFEDHDSFFTKPVTDYVFSKQSAKKESL